MSNTDIYIHVFIAYLMISLGEIIGYFLYKYFKHIKNKKLNNFDK